MKTILLIAVSFSITATLILLWRVRRRSRGPLFVRHRDRAIFDLLPCEDYDGHDNRPRPNRRVYLERLKWVKTSWLRGGRLVPTGEYLEVDRWELRNDFDEIHEDYVEAGMEELYKRSKSC